jgi:hypothetical protein
MPREMKPIGPGRLDALKGMMTPPEEEMPMPEMPPEGGGDLEGIIEALAADILPSVPADKRQHVEKAIAELEQCLGMGTPETPPPPAEPEPELPAA